MRDISGISGLAAITVKAAVFLAGLVAVAALLSGCGKEKEEFSRRMVEFPNSRAIQTEWIIKKLPNGDTLMDGVAREFYRDGSHKKSVVWKNGVRDGSAQAWYENGKQSWLKSYVRGKKESTWRLFYLDGDPWLVLQYKNDTLQGPAQAWKRGEPEKPLEAHFTKGICDSGDCTLMDPPVEKPGATPAEKAMLRRDLEIFRDFLD